MMFAAAWQHEAAAAIQRQMRGYRATTAEGHPATGWRSSQEAEVRNARVVQDNRDLKAANEELRTKLQTELQRAHMSSKCEPEKMEAELRAAAERARRLELELEAARTARAELMAGQAASEREVQQLRTELQVAEVEANPHPNPTPVATPIGNPTLALALTRTLIFHPKPGPGQVAEERLGARHAGESNPNPNP